MGAAAGDSEAERERWRRVRILAAVVKADGCSGAPDFWWKDCCDEHDVAYRLGLDHLGNPITKEQADRRLLECIREKARTSVGRYVLAPIYYRAVRLVRAARRAWLRGWEVPR